MLIPTETNLKELTLEKTFPIINAWSRLEGRPVTNNFDRALKAEVRDALWMLTRQWQLGEFEGDDAGSPVSARLCTTESELIKYKASDKAVQLFEKDVPFEAKVEQKRLPFKTLEQDISLDLRLIMGHKLMAFLEKEGLLASTKQFFLDHYGVKKPDPTRNEDATICAHPETWQQYAAVAGRMIDGYKFYLEIHNYFEKPDFPLPGSVDNFKAINVKFENWYRDLFFQPQDELNDAWVPSHLEYQFTISANIGSIEKVMHAEQYYHGHLDWYNVNVDLKTEKLDDVPDSPPPPEPRKKIQSLIPAPVMFEGMPNTRWWTFEDSKTNFSYVKPDTTDLAKLLLIEFGLVYANDWYLIPYLQPVGTLTAIQGLTLTNCFGENFWIETARKGDANEWTKWNMFSMNVDSDTVQPTDTDLLLLPTVSKIQEGRPLEEVAFIRDEIANMVWGIETIVPMAGGGSKSGFEAAAELFGFLQKKISDAGATSVPELPVKDGDEEAKIRYQVMNTIPENWIPFIPTHVNNSISEVQIQRAAMPRILQGDLEKPAKVRPRTDLLQFGLKNKEAYRIEEEEVGSAGARVTQSFQRTRWKGGKVFVWYGVHKTTGRGEGSSGLGFDRIVTRKG